MAVQIRNKREAVAEVSREVAEYLRELRSAGLLGVRVLSRRDAAGHRFSPAEHQRLEEAADDVLQRLEALIRGPARKGSGE